MKKIIVLLLTAAIIILCCACGGTTESVTVTENPEPTLTPEPETVPGTVKDINILLPYKTLSRNDEVSITGENDEYYQIILDNKDCFVLKTLVRTDKDEKAESREVYAKSGAQLFDNVYLEGDPIDTPEQNTKITIVDEFNGVAIVEYDGKSGYMSSDSLSDTEIVSWGGGWSNGESGGGGGDAPAPVVDGGDIALSYEIPTVVDTVLVPMYLASFPQFESANLTGTVFADGTVAYIQILGYGDMVKVIKQDGDITTILYEDLLIEVPSSAIRLDSDTPYESWDGYSKSGAKLCSDSKLKNEEIILNQNDTVKVVEEFDGYYIVEYNSNFYAVDKNMISKDEIPAWTYTGGGSGGGDVPSGGGEWTEPVM